MESAAERKARLKAMRAEAEAVDAVPRRDAGDECVSPESSSPHGPPPEVSAASHV